MRHPSRLFNRSATWLQAIPARPTNKNGSTVHSRIWVQQALHADLFPGLR
jgi:hypothetical protein